MPTSLAALIVRATIINAEAAKAKDAYAKVNEAFAPKPADPKK